MPQKLYEDPLNANELGPKNHAVVPAQSDTVDLAYVCLALYVGGAGTLKVNTLGGDTVTFGAVTAGTTLNLKITRVWSIGTSATSLVAMY